MRSRVLAIYCDSCSAVFGKRYTGAMLRMERMSEAVGCCELCEGDGRCVYYNFRQSTGDCYLLSEVRQYHRQP